MEGRKERTGKVRKEGGKQGEIEGKEGKERKEAVLGRRR